jgi:Tol biopolymer transport system component
MSHLASRLVLVSCLVAGSAAPLFTAIGLHRATIRHSPDTARIAFAAQRDSDWNIYVMPAGGGAVTRLT